VKNLSRIFLLANVKESKEMLSSENPLIAEESQFYVGL
jgi:hypothetical protein